MPGFVSLSIPNPPMAKQIIENPDVILIGSGIMSATLGALLKELHPKTTIQVYECTADLAHEASNGWNNAGTGHAGICELSYTPDRNPDGTVDVRKAIDVFAEFEKSRAFWAHCVGRGMIPDHRACINPVDHVSFVHGEEQCDFLRSRHAGLAKHHFFEKMQFSTDRDTIGSWSPLLTEKRAEMPIAATKMDSGTDVDFGGIARGILNWIGAQDGCHVANSQRVVDLKKLPAGGWEATIKNLTDGTTHTNRAKFVFVGAGGGSLHLLQKAGIPEAKGLGGFPIGGQWLVCTNEKIIERHRAKVYGQALDAAPTMAVPHLDTRMLDGKRHLLFGPFAAWTTKFLHREGSWLDLPRSIKPHNLATLIRIGIGNLDLVRYLVQQGTQSMKNRMEVLRIFYPAADPADWKLIDAGIRVQAIKKTDGKAGIVHYGTEVLTNGDRSISALLGASPGASTSVHITLEVLRHCFPDLLEKAETRDLLTRIIPNWDTDITLPENAAYYHEHAEKTSATLGL